MDTLLKVPGTVSCMGASEDLTPLITASQTLRHGVGAKRIFLELLEECNLVQKHMYDVFFTNWLRLINYYTLEAVMP